MDLKRRFLMGLALTAVLSVAALGGLPSLAPPVELALGPDGCELGFTCSNDPQGLALVDVDGDGNLDVVTANNGSDDVSVLLNDGQGGFILFATLTAGAGPSGIAAADFNRDGKADLAVANTADSTVGIFLGVGDGSFAAAFNVAVGLFPENVVTADFDGDGSADFATSDLFGDTVTVLLGNGDGSFAAPLRIAIPSGPIGLAVGDFNRDGTPDLVVTLDDMSPGEVAILLGDGAGGFAEQGPRLIAGDAPRSVAIGDFNGDGLHDLAVPNWGEDTVSVYFGNGDGTFEDGPVLDVGLLPEDVAIVDLDGDGAADIVTIDGFGADTGDGLLIVVPGNGNGTFEPAVAFAVGGGPSAVAVADLSGDGAPDIVTAHFDSDDLAVTVNLAGPITACAGDCNGDRAVSIGELIVGVNIALGMRPAADCTALDRDGSGTVSIAELVAAVNNALHGCD